MCAGGKLDRDNHGGHRLHAPVIKVPQSSGECADDAQAALSFVGRAGFDSHARTSTLSRAGENTFHQCIFMYIDGDRSFLHHESNQLE
jgi:hypothetical protein